MANLPYVVCALLCCSLAYITAITDDDLVEILTDVCPQVDICDKNATSAVLRPNARIAAPNKVSCCTGCSCHPDCRHHMNCCNRDDITDGDEPTNDPICTPMRIGQPSQKWDAGVPAFYTISTDPVGGCMDNQSFTTVSGQTLIPSCGPQRVAQWGEFYPVLSKTTERIYKNEACARCHGVNDSDVFMSLLECDKYSGNKEYMYKMSDHLEVFENGNLKPLCQVEFRHTHVPVLRTQRCLVEMVSVCTLGNIPTGPNRSYTDDLIKRACEEGFYSPIAVHNVGYKNIFCAFCGGYLKYVAGNTCPEDSTVWKGFNGVDLKCTYLLDPEHIQPVTVGSDSLEHAGNPYPRACLMEAPSHEPACRKIFCPTGMMRDNDGTCFYISKSWITSGLGIHVRLKFVDRDTPNVDIKDQLDIILTSPWPDDWFVAYVLRKLHGGDVDDMFAVHLLHPYSLNTNVLVGQMKDTMSRPWVVELNGTRVQFAQSFLEYSARKLHVLGTGTDTRIPIWTDGVRSDTRNNTGLDYEVWHARSSNGVRHTRFPSVIDKMFFCEQVELQPSEFEFVVDTYVVRNKLNDRLLFDQEFALKTDELENRVVRVCLSDTPLVRNVSNASPNLVSFTALIVTIAKCYFAIVITFKPIQ